MGAMLQKSLFAQLLVCFVVISVVEAWILPMKSLHFRAHSTTRFRYLQSSKQNEQLMRLNVKKSNGMSDVENSLGCFNFLKNELDFSDDDLTRILINNPHLLYLKVDGKLKPLLDVLKSFEFSLPQIKGMIKRFPSILAYDYEWSIPERLISLRNAFHLTTHELVEVVSNVPLLLVSFSPIFHSFLVFFSYLTYNPLT